MVKETVLYPELSYNEAAEMTYYGATVIHPKTIKPLANHKIPLHVRSFLNPEAPGTRIFDMEHGQLAPAIIFKKKQTLISFNMRDFSFITERNLSHIFSLLDLLHIKINLMQNSAISFSICIDNVPEKTDALINHLETEYDILFNTDLTLITVKNFSETPLENKLEELYSIIQFIDPFRLGSLFNFLRKYQVTDKETGKVIGYQNLNELGTSLSDILIRRSKKEVLKQLPQRQDKNLFVPMTDEQKQVHEEYSDLVARLVHKWRRLGFLPEKDRQRLMISLNLMRMSCNSTFIIDQRTRHDTKIDELMNILEEIIELKEEKIVIFSQWERMTRLVAQELEEKNISFEYLHGGVPSAKRKDLYLNFNKNPDTRVFLSTDAGGVGLNLQAASYMVNLDIPWNPATLEQRIARIYRMGQKRKVSIINLVSSGTIEHRMLDVLKFKSTMASGVLDNGEDAIFMSEDRFKQFMKSIENMVPGSAEGVSEAEQLSSMSREEYLEQQEISKPADPDSREEPADHFMEDEPLTNGKSTPKKDTEPTEGTELLVNGLKFFSQLSQTLKDKDATKKMVSSITEKDPNTGKTYLKIPVENENIVEEAISALGTLFKMLQK